MGLEDVTNRFRRRRDLFLIQFEIVLCVARSLPVRVSSDLESLAGLGVIPVQVVFETRPFPMTLLL